MQTENIRIATLVEADYNPRELTEAQFKEIRESIQDFGFVQPVVVNRHETRGNVIVGGHQRVRVAASLGFIDVPCVFVNLPLDQERRLNIRLNHAHGEFDMDKLTSEFDPMELEELGFTDRELGLGFGALSESASHQRAELAEESPHGASTGLQTPTKWQEMAGILRIAVSRARSEPDIWALVGVCENVANQLEAE